MADYVITKLVKTGQEETIVAVKEALAREGFGVLSEIDVQAKMKEKLGEEMRPYVILGACHPPSAFKAISEEISIGVLMPCNVVVHGHENGTAVKAVRPTRSLAAANRPDLADLGQSVEDGLARALESL
jgi:uncharacterized protein (DUF302 family)